MDKVPSHSTEVEIETEGDQQTPPTQVEIVPRPGEIILDGLFFENGDTPESGPVPIALEGSAGPAADEDGRFRLQIPACELGLGALDSDSPRIDLPVAGGSGRISVHRYSTSNEVSPLITPAAALLLQWDEGVPQLLVRGRAELPDGAQIAVRLIAAGHGLESTLLRIRGGAFAGELPLSGRDYHSGVYILQFAWGPSFASRDVIANLAASGRNPTGGGYERDVGVFFGTPAEARRQESEVREFYRTTLDDIEAMRDLLLVAGAQARGKRSKLLKDPDRVARIRAHPLAPRFDTLFEGRKLRLTSWRRLIDEQIRERLLAYSEFEGLPYRTKHPQAGHNLVMLAQHVRKYSQLESTVVYEKLGKARHPNDFVPNYDFGPSVERELTLERIRNFSEAVRGYVGL